MHRGYLDGYLLHRTCVFNALRLLFLPNFPGPTFIPCPTSILEPRVSQPYVFFSTNLAFAMVSIANAKVTNVNLKQEKHFCCELYILEWTHCDILDP